MKLTYPLKTPDLKRYLAAFEHYENNEQPAPELSEKETGGWYPLGMNDFWHAGVHLNGDRQVHAIADGKVVAYRVTDQFLLKSDLTIQFEEPKGVIRNIIEDPVSSNFILTKHTFTPPEGKSFNFYVLYMHLLPYQVVNEEKKVPRPLFHQSIVTALTDLKVGELGIEPSKPIAMIPQGAILQFEKPEEITTEQGQLIAFKPGQEYQSITGYIDQNREVSLVGYVCVSSATVKAESRHQPVRTIVQCPANLPVQKGDVLGWTGRDGTSDKKKAVHMELFITTEGDLTALRDYTKAQLKHNPELNQNTLLQLEDGKILNEKDITEAYIKTAFICDVSQLVKKSAIGSEFTKPYTVREAIASKEIAPKLRRMVTKHHPEWQPVDKNKKFKTRLEEPPYFWPPKKYEAFIELYCQKLGFWDQIGELKGKEPYYFHPIKFIEHLILLIKSGCYEF